MRGKINGRMGAAILGLLLIAGTARPQSADIQRPYEPVILNGSALPEWSGNQVAIQDLFLFAYDSLSQTWRQVPLQIDEVDSTGSFFGPGDGLLDDNDQLVFMAFDAGDRAPFNDWIDDMSARQHPRLEIVLTDPLDGTTAYLYLYRSNTLSRDGVASYMQYLQAADTTQFAADSVQGLTYKQGHSADTGLPNFLSIIDPEYGLATHDLMDLMKVRIQIKFFLFPITITESNFHALNLRTRIGPVRIIREIEDEIRLENNAFDTAQVVIKFYPHSFVLSGNLRFTAGTGFQLVRVSLDLDTTATGMTFYNPGNGPVAVDARPDSIDPSIFVHPQLNWDMVTGDIGSIIKVIRINLDSLNNAAARLYYHDAPSGAADGTDDTGDMVSFGDVGLQLTGTDINGLFPIFIQSFFLPGRRSTETAALLRDQVDRPLQKAIRPQAFDAIPPAAIADLTITESTDFTLTLEWTAPGDDSLGNGPAAKYTLYYATTEPGNDPEAWRRNAVKITEGLPAPAQPGTRQTYTLEGLDAGKPYYLAMTATDDFGNVSSLSNIARANTTVPVQLVRFRAETRGNQVTLIWQTAMETNNAGFFIDRRPEKTDAWEQIAFIKGKGTVQDINRYEWRDQVEHPGVYVYRLRQLDGNGRSTGGPEVRVNVSVPRVAQLYPNYPNPFRQGQSTVIQYDLPDTAPVEVTLRLFNVLGQELGVLYRGRQSAGYYRWQWNGRLNDGRLVAPGIYFLILETGNRRLIRKLAVLPF